MGSTQDDKVEPLPDKYIIPSTWSWSQQTKDIFVSVIYNQNSDISCFSLILFIILSISLFTFPSILASFLVLWQTASCRRFTIQTRLGQILKKKYWKKGIFD